MDGATTIPQGNTSHAQTKGNSRAGKSGVTRISNPLSNRLVETQKADNVKINKKMPDLDERLSDDISLKDALKDKKYKLIDEDALNDKLNVLNSDLEELFTFVDQVATDKRITAVVDSIRKKKTDLLDGCECSVGAKVLVDGLGKVEYQRIGDNYRKGPLYRPLKFTHRKYDVRYAALTAYDYYRSFYRPLVLRKIIGLRDINKWDPTLYKTLRSENVDFHDF